MRWTTRLALVVLTTYAQLGLAQQAEPKVQDQPEEAASELSLELALIRVLSDASMDACNIHDAKAVASLWTKATEYIDDAGPAGGVVGGSAVRGPEGNAAARGVAAGPNAAAGYARVYLSGHHTSAVAVRTNYTDIETGKTQAVQRSVDKQAQRVAFSVGDNTSNLIDTGLYNLTKDEAPALVHILVRKHRAVAVGST